MTKSIQDMRNTVSTNLFAALKDKGLSQKDMAERLNISRATASNWCSGVKKPKTENIVELARWLEVPTDYLLGNGVFSEWSKINADRAGILQELRKQWDSSTFHDVVYVIYGIEENSPQKAPISDFAYFINDSFSSVKYVDDRWVLKEKTPTPVTEDRRSQIQVLFDQLTPANQTKLLELCNLYLAAQQQNKETQ